MYIAWYVDDNKISHVDPDVVTKVIEKIEERFGKMSVTRGKKHVFLGMEICFLDNGTATIGMKEYVKEAISEFGEIIDKSAASPAKRDLFEVDGEAENLEKARRCRVWRSHRPYVHMLCREGWKREGSGERVQKFLFAFC